MFRCCVIATNMGEITGKMFLMTLACPISAGHLNHANVLLGDWFGVKFKGDNQGH